MRDDLKILQTLCDFYGISGDETRIGDIILKEISQFVSELKVDNFGSSKSGVNVNIKT